MRSATYSTASRRKNARTISPTPASLP
jgi:hypothetical protein